jgi:cell division protein FtsL
MKTSEAIATRRAGRTAPAHRAASYGRGGRHSGLRVVRPPRPRRRRRLGRIPFVIVSFVVVGFLMFGVVTVQAIMSQTSFRMRQLESRGIHLRQDYGHLKLEVARLSAPGRIVHEAKRLGLHLPDRVRTLPVDGPPATGSLPPGGSNPSFALKGVLGEEP